MPEDNSAAEKGTEDIVQRLEALRKKAPEANNVGEKEKKKDTESVEAPPADRRQKMARIVGVVVILLLVVVVFFGAYKVVYEPIMKKKVDEKRINQEQEQALINAREEKFNEINNAFAGLPSDYTGQKSALLEELNMADTLSKVSAIQVADRADLAWREYKTDQLDEKLKVTDKLKIVIGNDTYRGYGEIEQKIEQFPYSTLKGITIIEYSSEYFPIRLTREQAAGGWAEVGSLVNLWIGGETPAILARNARVIAVLRGSSSGVISLTESESKTASGGGSEGKGTVSSVTTGGVGSIPGSFPASAGYKTAQSATTFSVDISQIQRAAAASKLEEGYIEGVLGNYGLKLNKIEADTGLADFSAEYLILFEVGEEEVSDLVLKASPNSADRANVFVTIARPSDCSEESILCS